MSVFVQRGSVANFVECLYIRLSVAVALDLTLVGRSQRLFEGEVQRARNTSCTRTHTHTHTHTQVKAPPRLKMSNKEKKQLQKLREARKARGEEVTDSEEDA